jgi:DNA-directed RNA polymerase specialized sigma subunit
MNNEKARWNLSQSDIEHLSMSLKPVRTSREVAAILGLSTSLVCQLENSALRKIVRALKRLEANGQLKPQENNTNHE